MRNGNLKRSHDIGSFSRARRKKTSERRRLPVFSSLIVRGDRSFDDLRLFPQQIRHVRPCKIRCQTY